MKVAYCRVSSSGQNLDSQIDSVKKYGVDRIFQEKVSGTSTNGREQLKEMLNFVREGDEVVFTRVDRVARSVLDLQLIVKELTEKKVTLTATEQPISTKDATSKCFLDMLSVFSEFETNLRKERQMDGIKANKHKFKGRRISIDEMQVRMLNAKGLGATAIAKEMNIDRTSVYRILKRELVKS